MILKLYVILILQLYSLFFLWLYFILFYNKCLKTKINLITKTDKLTSISEIHSVTISGRGILSHLWTSLAISNLLLGLYSSTALLGFEELLLFLLPTFPSSIGPDCTTQFGTLNPKYTTITHYILIGLYFVLSIVIFIIEAAWFELSLQIILTIGIVVFHIKDHHIVILLEALAASCISIFYLRLTCTLNSFP